MNRRLTSVVVTTKNSARTIRRCLSSVIPYMEQGYVTEIVLVDGHSTDATLDVARSFPIMVLMDDGMGSIGAAWEIGWRNTREEFIMFLDSDVYLGDDFFPKIYEAFADCKIGFVSCCCPKGEAVNGLPATQTQSELWDFSAKRVSGRSSLVQRLWLSFVRLSFGTHRPLFGGPVMVFRRTCLESIDGLRGLSPNVIRRNCDLCLSERATRRWRGTIWPHAPITHSPRRSFRAILKQSYEYGEGMVLVHHEREFRGDYRSLDKAMTLVFRMLSPIYGLFYVARFRNVMHMVAYPLTMYGYVVGYFKGVLASSEGETRFVEDVDSESSARRRSSALSS